MHAYFSAPISDGIVFGVRIKRHRRGRHGTLAVPTIPRITAGSGPFVTFEPKIKNWVKVGGNINKLISAYCARIKVVIRGTPKFEHGAGAETDIFRAWTAQR